MVADAAVDGALLGSGTGRTHSREQRQQMLVTRLGARRIGMELPVAQQGFGIPGDQPVMDPVREMLALAAVDGHAA